jgi:hypothetical protein
VPLYKIRESKGAHALLADVEVNGVLSNSLNLILGVLKFFQDPSQRQKSAPW